MTIRATEELAGERVADPVTVVAVTTFDLDEYVFGALRSGAGGFLLRDIEPDELVATVRTVSTVDEEVSRLLFTGSSSLNWHFEARRMTGDYIQLDLDPYTSGCRLHMTCAVTLSCAVRTAAGSANDPRWRRSRQAT